jgi:hypothetical protein
MVVLTPTPIFMIYLTETDGDITIRRILPGQLQYFIKTLNIGPEDYALIRGEVLKGFNNKTFNVKGV